MNAEDAFINSKERNVFAETAPAAELLETLEQGLAHASPIIVITGESGLGKSTVMREAVARWASRVHAAWLDAGRIPTDALFGQTIRRFGGHFRSTDQRPEQVGRFAHALNSIRKRELTPVLVVDDAHELDLVTLAELGRIESAASATNVPFKLVLIGRPSLDERLEDMTLLPMVARIAVRGTIGPMALADTREYLAHRVEAAGGDSAHGFSKKAAREIHQAAAGVPTVVNALSDEAQRCANAAGTAMVGPEHVRAVIAAAFRSDAAPIVAPGAIESDEDDEKEDEARPSGSHARPKAKPKPSAAIPEKPKVLAAPQAAPTPPSAAAHVPPPTKRPAAPLPKMEDLDSTSPRVRDWVSRFTEGQPPIRFGTRLTPPPPSSSRELPQAFDPDLVPPPSNEPVTFESLTAELKAAGGVPEVAEADAAEEPVEAAAEAATPLEVVGLTEPDVSALVEQAVADAEAEAEAEAEPEAEAEAETEVEAGPAAKEDADAEVATPTLTAEAVSRLELVGVAPSDAPAPRSEPRPVAIEVKPEQLASPPLEVNEAPAPYTPEPPPREPLPATAEDDEREPTLIVPEPEPVKVAETVAASNGNAEATPAPEPIAPPEPVAVKESAPPDVEPEFVDRRRSAARPFEEETIKVVEAPATPVATTVAQAIDAIAAAAPLPASAANTATPAPASPTPNAPSRKKQRAAARRAERAARRAANAATRASEAADRAKSAATPQGSYVEAKPVATPAATPAAAAKPSMPAAAKPSTPAVAAKPASAPEPRKPEPVHAALEKFSDGPRSPRHPRLLAGIITGLIMLGMAITAIWLGRRGGFDPMSETTPITTSPETPAPMPAPAVSTTPEPALVDPHAPPASAPATSTAPGAVPAPGEQATANQAPATTTPTEPPAETNVAAPDAPEYCLAVGSYLFEDRARELARTLKRRTGQTVRVIAEGKGAEKSYRILYGEYLSEEAATRAADRLLARGIVTEALVEKLPQ